MKWLNAINTSSLMQSYYLYRFFVMVHIRDDVHNCVQDEVIFFRKRIMDIVMKT
jgi:hypothetical protein